MKSLGLNLVLLGAISAMLLSSIPRGVRNNNPGNIRKNPNFKWEGEIGKDSKGFAQFSNPVYGFRAMAKLIKNYHANYDLHTIRDIIYRYAPPNENPSDNYVSFVSTAIKIDKNKKLSMEELDNILPKLIYHMSQMEVGHGQYGFAMAKQGAAMA